MNISYPGLKKGTQIIINKQPYEIIEASSMFKGRGHSVLQAKLKNLITNEIIPKTFHPSDSFEEAEILKKEAIFLYGHRDKFFFCFLPSHHSAKGGTGSKGEEEKSKRFELFKEQIGSVEKFLKNNQSVEAIIFGDEIVNISLPIKITLKVIEAPPGLQGDRSQAGVKTVVLETKAEINVPLFIKQGDTIEINTEKEEYVRRIEKE